MRLEIDTTEFELRRDLVKQWAARIRAIRRQFAYEVAEQVYEDLMKRLPRGSRELRRSLKVEPIMGLPREATGYAVHVRPVRRRITSAESERTVLYVTPKKRAMQPIPQATTILQEHSPWTLDTLPFQPPPGTATIVSRDVGPRVVHKVRQLRNRDKRVWRRKMNELGVREVKKVVTTSEGRQVVALPDVAFESIRLEFGIGLGGRAHPHWRPSIARLASRGGAGMIAKKRVFLRTMLWLGATRWRSWPTRLPGRVSVSEAKRLQRFQEKLGIRVQR